MQTKIKVVTASHKYAAHQERVVSVNSSEWEKRHRAGKKSLLAKMLNVPEYHIMKWSKHCE